MRLKTYKIFFITILSLLVSCSSDESTNNDIIEQNNNSEAENELLGRWNLIRSAGGFAGNVFEYNIGDIVYDFQENNLLIVEANIPEANVPISYYRYEVEPIESIYTGILILNTEYSSYIEITGDTLRLPTYPFDGYSLTLIREN